MARMILDGHVVTALSPAHRSELKKYINAANRLIKCCKWINSTCEESPEQSMCDNCKWLEMHNE